MWRKKSNDLELLDTFLSDLEAFKGLREVRWERIDEEVQENNLPGTPEEDWIIPPDEDKTLRRLEKDKDYVRLRQNIEKNISGVREIAHFLHAPNHHDFDWLNFNNPLIGHEALNDALESATKLRHLCKEKVYFLANLTR